MHRALPKLVNYQNRLFLFRKQYTFTENLSIHDMTLTNIDLHFFYLFIFIFFIGPPLSKKDQITAMELDGSSYNSVSLEFGTKSEWKSISYQLGFIT